MRWGDRGTQLRIATVQTRSPVWKRLKNGQKHLYQAVGSSIPCGGNLNIISVLKERKVTMVRGITFRCHDDAMMSEDMNLEYG